MTQYARVIPYALLSTTPDRADNVLDLPSNEDFTSAQRIEQTGIVLGASFVNGAHFDCSTWTSIDLVRVKNTGTTFIEVDWHMPVATGGPGDVDTSNYLPPGRTMIIPGARPITTVFGQPGSVIVWGINATTGGSADILILGT